MRAWLVRGGRHGVNEDLALDKGVATIGWSDLGDLSCFKTKDELREAVRQRNPERNAYQVGQDVAQLWAFSQEIEPSDIIAMPLSGSATVVLGKVTGPYAYNEAFVDRDAAHTRAVDWIQKDLSRSQFDKDLRYSLGSARTVGKIERNNALPRLQEMLLGTQGAVSVLPVDDSDSQISDVGDAQPDVERISRDLIASRIEQRFKGHSLENLIAEILRAKGYYVDETPEGPDGGADLLASRGEFGFDPPQVCVQVKSSSTAVDSETVQQLQGAMTDFQAKYGLFVAWGGFKASLSRKRRQHFFNLRFWDSENVIDELLSVYDKLPDRIKGELPLKRIWTVVDEDI